MKQGDQKRERGGEKRLMKFHVCLCVYIYLLIYHLGKIFSCEKKMEKKRAIDYVTVK